MKRLIWLAVMLIAIPALANGQGAVSIETVNTLLPNYSIQAGQPARFVFRFNNTTGARCDISAGFKISSPDGAVWDSVTIDSAGPTVGGENRFISYFDIVYARWGGVEKGGDGTNPDTVGILGAGNRSRAARLLPIGYNDTALAITVWQHDFASFGKHICIDSSFWGVGGTWKWVTYDLVDLNPSFSGLAGHAYSDGTGADRIGSGYCFTVSDRIVPGSNYIRLTQWPSDVGGNDHWYAVVPQAKPWIVHQESSSALLLNGSPAHLATMSSAAENSFVLNNVINNLQSDAVANEFYLGAHKDSGVFRWINGDSWGYTNWWTGEPNGDGPAVAMWGSTEGARAGRWNDVPDDTVDVGPIHQLWALIEWDETITPPADTLIRLTQWPASSGGNDHWYAVIPQARPWTTQRQQAASLQLNGESGYLATVLSGAENDFILNHVINDLETDAIADEFYLGAHREFGTFSWITDEPWGFTKWWTGEPSGDGDAATIWGTTTGSMAGFWNDVPDDTVGVGPIHQLWAVVEWGSQTPPATDSIIRLTQWPTSQGGNDHWYAVVPEARPWKEHAQLAPEILLNGEPAHLATILSAQENQFIVSHVIDNLGTDAIADEFYLGAHRDSGQFHWLTGEVWNYTHWWTGEPNGDGKAVTIWGTPTGSMSGFWNDVPDDTAGVGPIHQLWAIVEWDTTSGGEPPIVDTLKVPDEFATIQQAIDTAANGSLILVAPGTYQGGINFNGKLVTVKSEQGPLVTTINLSAPSASTAMPSALVTFNHGETELAVLDGFTLDGGWIGVLCLGSGPTIRHNILKGQLVDNWAAISLAGSFPAYSAVEGPAPAVIVNNTIVGCVNGGISTFSTVAPTIKNNIIAFNGHYGIHRQSVSLPLDISFNDIYGNPEATQNVPDQGTGAIQVNPLFNDDKSLSALSPCINAGDPDSAYNDPDGSRNDMGAVPFGGGGPEGLMNLVQWRVADGGNDHWYAVLPQKLYWVEANLRSKTFSQNGQVGYLATVTSAAENQFITNHVLVGADQDNRFDNFFIGGRDLNDTWKWITNEAFGYSNWASGEPNNVGIETALAMYGHYDTYSHAIPGTWNNTLPDSTVNQLHQYWSVVEFGPIDTVMVDEPIPTNEWISLYCDHPRLDGINLEPGAVIRAFDPQGVLCGKAVVKANGSYGFLLIYRDDQYTLADEGALPGDELQFSINGEPVEATSELHWTANGDQFEACSFARRTCITLHLEQGWNLVSWNVGWSGTPQELLAPIVNCVDLVLAFDQGGLVYDPQLERFSTLSSMDYFHGYWFKMNCAADLEVCDSRIRNIPVIPVDRGWNLVSYLPTSVMTPQNGFITINDKLQVAIGYDHGARLYIPTNPAFNTLTELAPGFGYWLRMAEADYLEYGFMPTDEDREHQLVALAGSDNVPLGSRVWMSLYGDEITLDGQPLAANTTIEVFTADDLLVGSSVYANGVLKFMPVYGKDGDDASARLAAANDELTLKVNGQTVAEKITWTGEGTSYRLGALTTSGLPTTYSLEQNYPNPFNPATTIAFSVPNRQQVKLVVYNLLGQQVRTLTNETYDAGRYEIVWDGCDGSGNQVPTGVYFYRFETRDIHLTNKMMLLK